MMSESWHLKQENVRKEQQIRELERRCFLLAQEVAALLGRLDEAHWDSVILGAIHNSWEGGELGGGCIRDCRKGED